MNAAATKTSPKKTAKWQQLDAEKAKKLIGFKTIEKDKKKEYVEAHPEMKVFRHKLLGDFVLENNVTNRPFNLGRAVRLGKKFLNGTFAGMQNSDSETDNGESWIFNGDGSVLSCAHRLMGLVLAQAERDVYATVNPSWLEDHDVSDVIACEALIVNGIHDPAANTIDTGDGRKNKDVFFRNPEVLKEYTSTDKARLAGELQKAVRLVYCRLNGESDQTARGKFENEQAIAFHTDHPLIETALVWLFEESGKEAVSKGGQRLTKYHGGLTLGVLAGMYYLAYLSAFDRKEYDLGDLDLSKITDADHWDFVESFFQDIRKLDDSGEAGIKKADSPIVSNMISLFMENDKEKRDKKWKRDNIQSVIAMSYLAFADQADGKFKTVQAIKKGLNKDVVRFNNFGVDGCGLDLSMTVLKANNWIQEEPKLFRTEVEGWTVDDPAWIYRGYDMDPYKGFGVIEAFSIDGTTVTMRGRGDDEGVKSTHPVSALRAEEPQLPTTCKGDKFAVGDNVTVLYEIDEETGEKSENWDAWDGQIFGFSDDGTMAVVGVEGYEQAEGFTYDIGKQLKAGHMPVEEPTEA